MRKKFIKSSRPTYKKRIKKAQQGMKFVSYNPVSNPTIDYTDITNPINPFSEYNYNTTYDKPEALVVPVRDTDVVANNHTVEPVINKSVASKPVTDKPVTANSTWKSPYTNRKQWSTELINAYKKAGITNDNAIRMLLAQDALESSWGKSAQGKYNFGNLTTGSSWKGDYVTGNDKNAKGEAIKQKFRSYNSMDEYAADKIQFLKRLYDFDENDDINKFVAKLTGSNKGKRRYAEATNYAKVLTGVYNGIPKGENGMIIKYQNPPHGIARRDAIQDYRPEIPFSPIKQPVKPYMPTQQPILSPDNRTGWEKEVSRQIKADRAKNDNLYGNQHTWNWSAPFTNARITKDNASAMFDFDKSAAMSTFAIGQGIASPVTTATSIATSLVGAGIGNKVAGEKGALVGGFVGGMVNPKIRFGKSSSTNQIRKDLIYGSKINGKMARLSQAEAEKANQEGYHNALSVIANPVVVATAKRNAEVAKRIGFKPLVYGINGKPVEFDNSSALHFYIMADEYPTSKIVRTDLGGMATGRWVRDPKTKQDRIELDNSVGDYKTAEEIFTHENLHKGRYGETRMQMLRVNKLIDEARAAEALPQMPEYLLGAGEAAVNTNDVRRALGLEFGQKYPGWKITKEIVDMFSRSKHPKAFVMKSFKQDTPRDYKRIWDALTGKWFMYPVALGVGMDLMNY